MFEILSPLKLYFLYISLFDRPYSGKMFLLPFILTEDVLVPFILTEYFPLLTGKCQNYDNGISEHVQCVFLRYFKYKRITMFTDCKQY